MRESFLRVQPLILLLPELGDAPLLKEVGRDAFCRGFVSNVFGAVFTKLKMRALTIGLGPRATGTINAARLIHFQQGAHTTHEPHLFGDSLHRRDDRRRATGSFWCLCLLWHPLEKFFSVQPLSSLCLCG